MKAIDDDNLHRYVDGFLDAQQRLEVDAWLAERPLERRRVRAWSEQNRLLHQEFDPVLNDAIPQRLLAAARGSGHSGGTLRWAQAAAAVAMLVLAGLFGYDLGLRNAPPATVVELDPLARAAAVAHAVYTPEVRHPVEVGAAEAGHLVAWLSKRLERDLKAPDFSAEGYALLGGRLLPGEGGPVAQFMYESAHGQRLTLYVRREDAAAGPKGDTAFRYAVEDGVGVFYWIDHESGFALSGDLDRPALLALAHTAYDQMTD